MGNQVYRTDGHLHEATADDVRKGNVFRPVQQSEGTTYAFGDSVVVDVFFNDRHGRRLSGHEADQASDKRLYAKLARPYCFVSGAETCCPSVLTGVEQFVVEASRLHGPDSPYRLVVQSTGLAANYTT